MRLWQCQWHSDRNWESEKLRKRVVTHTWNKQITLIATATSKQVCKLFAAREWIRSLSTPKRRQTSHSQYCKLESETAFFYHDEPRKSFISFEKLETIVSNGKDTPTIKITKAQSCTAHKYVPEEIWRCIFSFYSAFCQIFVDRSLGRAWYENGTGSEKYCCSN